MPAYTLEPTIEPEFIQLPRISGAPPLYLVARGAGDEGGGTPPASAAASDGDGEWTARQHNEPSPEATL